MLGHHYLRNLIRKFDNSVIVLLRLGFLGLLRILFHLFHLLFFGLQLCLQHCHHFFHRVRVGSLALERL